mgnify:FL=1
MSYKLEKLEFSKACEKISEYQYALLYMISEVILNKTELLGEINWEECMEARFFSEDKELHFFDVDGKKQAVAVSDEDGNDELVKEYELAGKFRAIGSSVFVKEYIGYDEDGQANVVLTRLQGIK